MRFAVRTVGAAAVALLLAGSAWAQSLSLEGGVKEPRQWSLDDLKKMPAVHQDVSFQGERGAVKSSFTGVTLWSLIEAAGGLADTAKGAELRHAIRITAKDGYVVVGSTGEIAPAFGGKEALVAYERDGKPLDTFRLVMPGDKRGGRAVRDLVSIKIE